MVESVYLGLAYQVKDSLDKIATALDFLVNGIADIDGSLQDIHTDLIDIKEHSLQEIHTDLIDIKENTDAK